MVKEGIKQSWMQEQGTTVAKFLDERTRELNDSRLKCEGFWKLGDIESVNSIFQIMGLGHHVITEWTSKNNLIKKIKSKNEILKCLSFKSYPSACFK